MCHIALHACRACPLLGSGRPCSRQRLTEDSVRRAHVKRWERVSPKHALYPLSPGFMVVFLYFLFIIIRNSSEHAIRD